MSWRRVNAAGALISAIIWGIATYTDWVNSVRFISHISMATMVFTFIAAWRADVPNRRGKEDGKNCPFCGSS
jgi:hypothetical protein